MGLYEQYAVIMWSIAQITISRSSTMPASVKNARQFIKWSVIFNGCRHIFSIRKVKIVLQNKSDPPKCRHWLKWKSFIKLSVGVYRCRHIFRVRLVLQKKSDPPKLSETTVYRPCGSAKGKNRLQESFSKRAHPPANLTCVHLPQIWNRRQAPRIRAFNGAGGEEQVGIDFRRSKDSGAAKGNFRYWPQASHRNR